MTFVKGQSGNPSGLKKGTMHARTKFFYEFIDKQKEELLDLAMHKARNGDARIIQFLIERFAPKQPLHVIEYQKLELECEKLRKENELLGEAPELLELLKEDPLIKERLKERLKRRTFTQEVTENGKTDTITAGQTEDASTEEGSAGGNTKRDQAPGGTIS